MKVSIGVPLGTSIICFTVTVPSVEGFAIPPTSGTPFPLEGGAIVLEPSLGVLPIFGGVTVFGLVTLEGSSPMLGMLEVVLVILVGLRLVMLVGRTLVGADSVN